MTNAQLRRLDKLARRLLHRETTFVDSFYADCESFDTAQGEDGIFTLKARTGDMPADPDCYELVGEVAGRDLANYFACLDPLSVLALIDRAARASELQRVD